MSAIRIVSTSTILQETDLKVDGRTTVYLTTVCGSARRRRMTESPMNNELGRKKAAVAYVNILYWNCRRRAEENYENRQSE
jgi:hypothetical protein